MNTKEQITQKLIDAMPTTYTTWVTLILAIVITLGAIILAILGKTGVGELLNYASLLLGIQGARTAVVAINSKREDSKVAVAAGGTIIPVLPPNSDDNSKV